MSQPPSLLFLRSQDFIFEEDDLFLQQQHTLLEGCRECVFSRIISAYAPSACTPGKKGNVGQMAMEMFNVSLLITRRWTDFHFLWGKKEIERLKKKSKRDKNTKQGHFFSFLGEKDLLKEKKEMHDKGNEELCLRLTRTA